MQDGRLRKVLERIGHVVQMGNERLTKAIVFGWCERFEEKDKKKGMKQKTVKPVKWRVAAKARNECEAESVMLAYECFNNTHYKFTLKWNELSANASVHTYLFEVFKLTYH